MMSVPATRPDASRFTSVIDNPFMTLRPGTTFVYANPQNGESNTFIVTHDTRVVDGVTCVVVRDIAYVNGLVVEDTLDWFAQDDEGNVWYFGEASRDFEPGNPDPVNSDGSWESGIDGAEAGIIMLANPETGDDYAQESAPGIAEDRGTVLSLEATVHVGYGSFEDALQTRDLNPLEPSEENKFYAEGVGNLLTTNPDGEREALVRIIVEGTGGDDLVQGYAGGDGMFGRAGDDRMNGGTGNDTMSGGSGDDVMTGGAGFDRLAGGRGDDVLRGGQGGDTFVFRDLADGRATLDTILDYRRAQLDVIDIGGGAASIVAEALVDGAWELTLAGDGDRIRLEGVVDRNGDGHIIDQLLFA
ncbi:MAG: calcium-binding protein [Gemmobacter sp.]